MSGSGNGRQSAIAAGIAAHRRAGAVSSLRRLATSPGREGGASAPERGDGERCDLCGRDLPSDHRHLLHLEERRIDCSCESCWAMRSGDGPWRPVGTRTLWLPDLDLSGPRWASFGIPIGLAFFMRSSVADGIVALYPSPAGATESELDRGAWELFCEENPVLRGLEPDSEGLIVNRLAEPPQHAIAPIDDCYRLVGTVKASWEGISGGSGFERALRGFFDDLRGRVPA